MPAEHRLGWGQGGSRGEGWETRQPAAVRGDSLLSRMIGNTCPAERRMHYSQPRVPGPHGRQEGDRWGGSIVGGAGDGLPALSRCPLSVPCCPLPDNVPQLWLSSYSIHSKKLFILRTSRHVYEEREQCNVHPRLQCPALKTISLSNLLPSTRAPVDGLEADPRRCSSSVNTARTFLLKVYLLYFQLGKRVNFIL